MPLKFQCCSDEACQSLDVINHGAGKSQLTTIDVPSLRWIRAAKSMMANKIVAWDLGLEHQQPCDTLLLLSHLLSEDAQIPWHAPLNINFSGQLRHFYIQLLWYFVQHSPFLQNATRHALHANHVWLPFLLACVVRPWLVISLNTFRFRRILPLLLFRTPSSRHITH